jgi:soluble lytic murein transglycosylase-like protein
LETLNLNLKKTQRTFSYRWLNVVGLCFFIGLTLYANNEDPSPLSDDVSKHQVEGISNITMYTEPIYYKAVQDASAQYALDPKLIATIIHIESRGNVMAISPKGAKGLMQLTPLVYKHYGVNDPFDIEENIYVGTAHLASLLKKFDGNLEHALAAYNCGTARVIEHNGLPPIKETRDYVQRVMEFYRNEKVPTGAANRRS